jgi:metal-responsive CopG/Arc/MetJ family transcriptional regulator
MKTIQITIEDELLDRLDTFLDGQPRARSAFIRDAIAENLRRERIRLLDQQEAEAYRRTPIAEDEFVIDEEFQPWAEDDGSDWSAWEKTK